MSKKNILILGAGQSAPALIRYLLEKSTEFDWHVTVADMDQDMAQRRVNGHPNGVAISFNVDDTEQLQKLVAEADIVANLMPPPFQPRIVKACVEAGTHQVSASYESAPVKALDSAAKEKGVTILNEMGLDPGLDHMSAVKLITRERERGGVFKSFCSYGSGVPEPGANANPMNYIITWNPRNVVMAGQAGAQYLENGEIKIVPAHRVFWRTWPMDVDGVGTMEAYPNRDSLAYIDIFNLKHAHTMIRGTLRYPGYSEAWMQLVRLGMPNESMVIPNLKDYTWSELTAMFLPGIMGGDNIRQRVARRLQISPTGAVMDKLEWLGLFSDEKIGYDVTTAASALTYLLKNKLAQPAGVRDMVVLLHRFEIEYPEQNGKLEQIVSTFVYYGDPNGETAMAKTVGLPAGIAVKRILTGELNLTGCHIPIKSEIYEPILAELDREFGIRFVEKAVPM